MNKVLPIVLSGIVLMTGIAPIAGLKAPLVMAQSDPVPTVCQGIAFSRDLSLGMSGTDVKCLQAMLNLSSGTALASTGPGSSGQETNFFGVLTQTAVIKFQQKYASVILTPLGLTAGTGFVGSLTRAELNSLLGVPPQGGPTSCNGVTFSRDLSLGMTGQDVECLQAILNLNHVPGTQVAASGPGSPGEETQFFGLLTQAAVIKFQEGEAEDILTPLGLTHGTGVVGPLTRAELTSILNGTDSES